MEGKKPWLYEDGGRRLEAFLGSRGMKTSLIRDTDELIQTAAGVFEIPPARNCLAMADAIAALPKGVRRKKARANIGPSPHRHGSAGGQLTKLAKELGFDREELRSALAEVVRKRRS